MFVVFRYNKLQAGIMHLSNEVAISYNQFSDGPQSHWAWLISFYNFEIYTVIT